jgi:hypothetical protein
MKKTKKIEYLPENNQFSTFDLSLSAALISEGYRLWGMDKTDDKNRVKFVFIREKNLDDSVQSFWADSLLVNPRIYFDNLKLLKNRMYSTEA